jgi:hypothetical protein
MSLEPWIGVTWASTRSPKPRMRVRFLPPVPVCVARVRPGRHCSHSDCERLVVSMVYRLCTSPCGGEGSGSTPGAHPNAGIVQWRDSRPVSGLRRFDPILPAPVWRFHEVVACGSDLHQDGSLPSAASSALNDCHVTDRLLVICGNSRYLVLREGFVRGLRFHESPRTRSS